MNQPSSQVVTTGTSPAPAATSMLDALASVVDERSRGLPDELFRLRGLWRIDYRYRPNVWERDLSYSMLLAQTMWQGCCYVDYRDAHVDDSLLGGDARRIETPDLAARIAILDAVYAAFAHEPVERHTFSGTAEDKAVERARIVVREVVRLLGGDVRGARILNVGVMGNFVHQLVELGATVTGSDFDPALVGGTINSSEVHDGRHTLELVARHDVVLATGMTLYTQTLDDIVATARACGTKVVLFAATGSHFGGEYCRSFGVDVVVAEPQPQYMFQGQSRIDVHRRT